MKSTNASNEPDLGDHLVFSVDYSQLEMRLLSASCADADVHRRTASLVFGVPTADVTPEMRSRAKVINFGAIYGARLPCPENA